jgi:hypothetical protein
MKDLKLKLEELNFKVKVLLNEDSGEENDFYLNINNKIDIFEGAYQKWDTYMEEIDLETSFLNDEDLIEFLNNNK